MDLQVICSDGLSSVALLRFRASYNANELHQKKMPLFHDDSYGIILFSSTMTPFFLVYECAD